MALFKQTARSVINCALEENLAVQETCKEAGIVLSIFYRADKVRLGCCKATVDDENGGRLRKFCLVAKQIFRQCSIQQYIRA